MKHTLTRTLIICAASMMMSASSVGAQTLTSEQQGALNSGRYSAGAELSQRIKEVFNHLGKNEAEESFKNKTEESAPKATEPAKDTPEIKLFLKKVMFTDSEILDEKVLLGIAEKYEGKEVVIGDLYTICDEVNRIYARKGYLAAKALIKAQKINDGVVVITLVEGRVGKSEAKGNKVTKSKYIESYFDIKVGEFPNFNNIRKDIQKFNATNSTKLQIKMLPGKAPRTTDIYIVAAEPAKTGRLSLFSDNAGKENSGEWRYGISYSDVNLSGYCDTLNFASMFAKTSETSFLNYAFPVDNKGNRIALNYSANRMRISHGFLKPLDVRGSSEAGGLTFSHPTVTTNNRRQKLTAGITQQHAETDVMGVNFVHDDNRRYSLGYDSLLMRKTDLFYYRPVFSYTDYRGLTNDLTSTKFNLDAMWQKYKNNGDSITLQLSAQKAFEDNISSADRFYIGGLYSVRGYEESLMGSDSGFNFKFDYAWHTKVKGLRAITFADYARISGENAPDDKDLYSVGYGIEYRKKLLSITATVGYALKREINGTKVDASNVNLSVNYMF